MDSLIRERPDKDALRKNYIGTSMLPIKPVSEYELTWDVIQSANHIAGIYSMDGTPIPGNDPSFYQMMANVINIMASRKLDEETVMTLREPGELALKSRVVQSKRDKALRILRNKTGNADDEVDTTIEYLIMSALQGSIPWPPTDDDGVAISGAPAYWGNASFTLDLGLRAAFVQDISSLAGYDSRAGGGYNWKHASADPVLDLEVIRELGVQTVHMPYYGSTIIMSEVVLSWMATRPNVLQWFRGDTGPASDTGQKFINITRLREFLGAQLGYKIKLYDSVFTYESNLGSESGQTENWVHFLKPGKIIIIPPGALGSNIAYFATAPTSGADDSYRTGKYSWAEKQRKPPWSWEVGVGIKGFPILKSTQEIMVFDVFS
jgi:hypothetical protein